MDMGVLVPRHVIEGIFRLFDLLDGLNDSDIIHFDVTGYTCDFEYANAFRELKIKIGQLRKQSVEVYLLTVDDVTDDEMRELREWSAAGYSVYDNPYMLCDESGRPMDFITGCRVGVQMAEEDFLSCGLGQDETCYDAECGEIPF